jgi:hypothetical protein
VPVCDPAVLDHGSSGLTWRRGTVDPLVQGRTVVTTPHPTSHAAGYRTYVRSEPAEATLRKDVYSGLRPDNVGGVRTQP